MPCLVLLMILLLLLLLRGTLLSHEWGVLVVTDSTKWWHHIRKANAVISQSRRWSLVILRRWRLILSRSCIANGLHNSRATVRIHIMLFHFHWYIVVVLLILLGRLVDHLAQILLNVLHDLQVDATILVNVTHSVTAVLVLHLLLLWICSTVWVVVWWWLLIVLMRWSHHRWLELCVYEPGWIKRLWAVSVPQILCLLQFRTRERERENTYLWIVGLRILLLELLLNRALRWSLDSLKIRRYSRLEVHLLILVASLSTQLLQI